MSIIYDALTKAVEKRSGKIPQPQIAPSLPLEEKVVYQQKPEPEITKPPIEKTEPLSGNEKSVLRKIVFATGAIVLVSLAVTAMVRQSIDYTVNRSLAAEKKYEALPEPLKNIPGRISAAEPRSMLPVRHEFMLTGIVSDKDSPMAIINGEVYMVGDRVETAKVLEISGNTVVLENEGQRIELKVK